MFPKIDIFKVPILIIIDYYKSHSAANSKDNLGPEIRFGLSLCWFGSSLMRFGLSLGWLWSNPGRFGLVWVEFRLSLRRFVLSSGCFGSSPGRFGLVWVES